MRTLLLVFCTLLIMSGSMEARKKKFKTPASQNTALARQHKAMMKKVQKNHKAPKHRQRVN